MFKIIYLPESKFVMGGEGTTQEECENIIQNKTIRYDKLNGSLWVSALNTQRYHYNIQDKVAKYLLDIVEV